MHPGARTIAAGVLVFVSLAVFIPGVTEATLDTPQILSYQGRLTDAQKVTVADGAQSMKFAIFDASAGGTCLWSAGDDAGDGVDTTFSAGVDCPANVPSTAISVSVTDGLFNVLLGASPQNALPDSIFNTTSGQERWLEIRIGAETLTPRRRLVSSASALQAGNASLLDNFDTSQVGGSVAFVPVTDSSGNLTLTKNLTVDTDTLFVDSTNDRVSIGTLVPTAKRFETTYTHTAASETVAKIESVWNLAASGSGSTGLSVIAKTDATNANNMTGFLNGLTVSSDHFGSGTATTVAGIRAFARSVGTNTVSTLRGIDGVAVTSGVGSVTTDAIAVRGSVSIATSGAVTNGYAMYAADTSFSSGTYTNQAGIAIENQTIATNRTNLLVGTSTIPSGVYSIYNSSSSDNYFAGNVGIGTASPASLLDIRGAYAQLYLGGTGGGQGGGIILRRGSDGSSGGALGFTGGGTTDVLQLYNSDNEIRLNAAGATSSNIITAYTNGSERMRIDSSGNVGIGTTSPDAKLELTTESTTEALYMSHYNNTAGNTSNFRFRRSRGTEASPTVVASGDSLPSFVWQGYDGNSFENAASIDAYVDGTPGDGDMPGRLVFWTTPDGALASLERMRIDSAGNIGMGTSAPNTVLDVNGAFSMRGMSAPAVSPSGQGRIYFDSTSNTFKISQNASLYVDIATSTTAFVNGGNTFPGTATLGTNDSSVLAFETNNVERGRFEAGGNFMVGATALGSVHSTFSGTSWANNNNIYAAGDIAAQGAMFANSFTAGDSSTVYSTSSAVANSTFTLQSTGSLTLNAATSGGADDIVMTTAGTEQARLLENGNFGIGTASAGAKLQVTSTAAGTAATIIRGAASQTANLTSWQNSAGSTLAYVDPSGNITTGTDFLAASGASLATGYTTTSVADTTTTQRQSVTVIPSDGNPVLAWSDGSNIKVRKCTASDCSTSSGTVTIDTGTSDSSTISGAIAPDGNPFFVYQKTSNVRVAHCTSQSCSTADVNTAVDTANTLGTRTAVGLISSASAMAIAYSDTTTNNTKYIRCDDPTSATPCSSSTSAVVAGGASACNGYLALAVVGDNTAIVFTNAACGDDPQTVANKCSDSSCSSVSSTALSGTGGRGVHGAATGPDGFAGVTSTTFGGSVIFTRCTNTSCSSHSTTGLGYGTGGFLSGFSAVVIPSSNNPVIAIVDSTPRAVFLTCTTSTCSSSSATTISPAPSSGSGTSIALNASGDAVMQYGRNASSQLVIAKLLLSSVTATGTDIGASATRLANGYFSGEVKVGALTVDGTGAGQGGLTTVGSVTFGDGSGTDRFTANLGDNITDALDIQQGSNNYININTTNASENLSFGNATTNPTFNFLGTGVSSFAGNVGIGAAAQLVVSDRSLTVSASGASQRAAIEILGNSTSPNTSLAALTFHNEQSTASGKVVASIEGYTASSYDAESGAIRFITANTAGSLQVKMTLDESGHLGLGTTAPINSVVGNSRFLTVLGGGSGSSEGTLELASGQADADGIQLGKVLFTNSVTTDTEKKIAYIQALTDGTTANNRGGQIQFHVQADGSDTITQAMTIRQSGNVGIGTAAPGAMLQVDSTATATNNAIFKQFAGQTADVLQWRNSSDTVVGKVLAGTGGAIKVGTGGVGVSLTADAAFVASSPSGANAYMRVARDAVTDTAGYELVSGPGFTDGWAMRMNASSTNLSFYNAGTGQNRVTFTGAGNVGIGTTTPLTTFDLVGNARSTGKATAVLTGSIDPTTSTTVTGVGTLFLTELQVGDRIVVSGETRSVVAIASNTSLTVDLGFTDNPNDTSPDVLYALSTMKTSAGVTQFVVNDLGNVGIGSGSPDMLLETESASSISDGINIINSSTGDPILKFSIAGGGATFTAGIDNSDLDKFKIGTTALDISTRLTINASGLTGIGTSTPVNRLDVEGALAVGAAYSGTSTAPTNGAIIEGSVGIGTSAPGVLLTVGDDSGTDSVEFNLGTGTSTIDTRLSTGTIWNMSYGATTALTGSIVGMNLNLQNVSSLSGNNFDSMFVSSPGGTLTASTSIRGIISSGQDVTQNAGGTGTTITRFQANNPNVTLTAGTSLIANGYDVASGTITTGGTQRGYHMTAFGVGAGTLEGVSISSITGGAGTENAIVIGSGWDNQISANGFTVTGAGATSVTLAVSTNNFGLCHETNGAGLDEIKDCSGAPSADYAEQYPVATGSGYGDLMVMGSVDVTTTQGDTIKQLVQSTTPYQAKLVGVISDPSMAGDFNSIGYNIMPGDNPMPVALNGRVKVNVNDENGAINVGDPITSSSTAGQGMKATKSGMIIGRALSSFAGPGSGSVMVFMHTEYYVGATLGWNGTVTSIEDSLTIQNDLSVKGNVTLGDTGTDAITVLAGSESLRSGTDDNTFITKLPKLSLAGGAANDGNCSSGTAEGWIFQNDAGTQVGHACVDATDKLNWYAESFNSTGTDIAESYNAKAGETIDKGDVVALDITSGEQFTVTKAEKNSANIVLGIIATRPGIKLSGVSEDGARQDNVRPVFVALAGRVPTNVSDENGPIAVGDMLTLSSKPGVAMKRTDSGPVIGRALRALTSGTGKIEVFVHLEYLPQNQASQIAQPQTQNFQIFGDLDFAGYSITNIKAIRGQNWSIDESGALAVKTAKTGALIITKTDEKATLDSVMFPMGSDTVFVTNPAAHETSEIFLSWQGNPGSISWVQDKHEGGFTVKLAKPTDMGVKMSYWIVDVVDERAASAVAPAEAPVIPATEPTAGGSPTETTTLTAPAETTTLTAPAETTTLTAPAETTTLTTPAEIIVPTTTAPPATDPIPATQELVAPTTTLSEPTPVPAQEPIPAPAPTTEPALETQPTP